MSVTENEATAAVVTTEDDERGDNQPCDARSEASTVPATAEMSKGVASLPSPNKTGEGRQQVVYSILEETPPWTRQSFMDSMFSITSFQEDSGASPQHISTARLTPGLRRLCLEASPSLSRSRTERHSHVHQATSPSLENETPPWMKASFMDYSVTTPTDQANPVELSTSTDIVLTVPLPDIVKLNSQNDTMEVECENCTTNDPPNDVSPSPQTEVNLPYKDSPVSAIANTKRPAIDINSTMDLPGGSAAAAASNTTTPIDELNTTANLTSACCSPTVKKCGINPSTSTSDLNKTPHVADHSASSVALTSEVGDGNKSMETMQTVSPNMAVPNDASFEVPDASIANRLMNGTMELVGCAGGTTMAAQKNITMEMGKDSSTASPAASSGVPTPVPPLNTTVNQEDDSKSPTAVVNTTIPVNHNNTVDFSNAAGGTDSFSVATSPNGTVDLAAVATATPTTIDKQCKEMNNTVDLVCSESTPLTITTAGRMNSTVDLQNTTTTNSSPSIPAVVQKLTDFVDPSLGSPATVANSTMDLKCKDSPIVTGSGVISDKVNLTSVKSPCEPSTAVAKADGTVNLTSSNSPCMTRVAKADGTVNLTSSNTPCVTRVAKADGTVNLMCAATPSMSGIQKMDNTVDMETSNHSSSPEAVAANGQRDHVSQECTSPSSDPTTAAAQQGTVGIESPCAANGTVSNSATLTLNLNLSEAEVTVERSAPESRLSAQFMLDDSLDLQACSLVTSTPMPEHREFSFSRPADVFINRASEARKQLMLPTNTTITTTTTTNADTRSSSPPSNGSHDSDSPVEGGAGASSTESSSPTEAKEVAQASLAQKRGAMPKPTSIALPKAGGAAAAPGAKPSGLPVTRRTIPKPTRRTGLLGTTTVANSTVEAIPAPSGIPGGPNRLSLGMKAALRSAASAAQPQPASSALQKRLSLAPPLSSRLKKKPNEGAIPNVSKDAAANSERPTRASTGIKRPVPEPKGGPAKRSKEEASVSKESAAPAGRPSRNSTGKKALPEPSKGQPRRPAAGPVSRLRPGLLMKKGPVLPTVPEDAISTHSNHTISGPAGSSVTMSSLDSEGTYLCEGEKHSNRKTDCRNCELLQQQNEQLCKEIEALKAQLLKMQNP